MEVMRYGWSIIMTVFFLFWVCVYLPIYGASEEKAYENNADPSSSTSLEKPVSIHKKRVKILKKQKKQKGVTKKKSSKPPPVVSKLDELPKASKSNVQKSENLPKAEKEGVTAENSVKDIVLPLHQTLSILDRELGQKILKMNEEDEKRAKNPQPKDINAESLKEEDLLLKGQDTRKHEHLTQTTLLESDGRRLIFKSPKPMGLALIKILDDYWLFCDRCYDFQVPKKFPLGLEEMHDESQSMSTIFKLRVAKGFWPLFSRQKRGWILEFSKNPSTSRTRKVMQWSSASNEPLKILMPNYVNEVAWTHPLTKMPYAIYTSSKEDGTFTPHEHFIQLDIMESYLGLAVRPKTQTLVAKKVAEDLYIFDADGIFPPMDHSHKIDRHCFFFTDKRSPYQFQKQLQQLSKVPETMESVYEQIRASISLGFFSEAGILITKIKQMHPIEQWQEQGRLNMMRLVLLTLSPHDETWDETLSFVNHIDQSPEFEFWYRLFKRIPQDYGSFVENILSHYPLFLKNKAAELLLDLPDEPENLKGLLRLKGLHKDLKERARLKLSLMPPVDLRELEELSQYSLQRDVQARAKLQLLVEQQREFEEKQEKRTHALKQASKKDDENASKEDGLQDMEDHKKRTKQRKEAIADLEDFLFSFGDQTFAAKSLLSTLYLEQRDYAKALMVLKDVMTEEPDREREVKEKMELAFIGFFDLLTTIKEIKTNISNERPQSPPHPLEVVAFYNDFKYLMPNGPMGNKILDHVVDNLRALSLYQPALEILNKSFEQNKDDAVKTDILFKSAHLYIENNDFEGAEQTLKTLQSRDLSMEQKRTTQLLLSDAYLKQGKDDGALRALEGDDHLSLQLQREKIYWQSKNYKAIMTLSPTILSLIEDKETKAKVITHLAFAEILEAPFEPPYEDLRERYQKDVMGTSFEDLFMKITTPDLRVMDGMRHFEELDRLLKD